ncbi:Adhesin BmaC autotransporter [Pseudomonas extremaustralis]|uniref:Adhesin BmaC autotransporter n=1 Tax=Pseudomonas extremaustralis TaxID=359110 RepID=A0A5M9J374_9PSED|nr:autotransporter outer membrane beta-barrel domain-containing protein [Pseudomonas extremaustralis]KAA8563291.1 Adhesin BmaC autotransporter [Pseudomonas extremaustralis]
MRTPTPAWLYAGILSLMALTTWPLLSQAACTINITSGDDTSTCDSGTAPGFTDNAGNNTLDIRDSGRITGNVTFGAGNDLVDVNGPTADIDGALNQGDGSNIFRLNLGTVGSVTQGSGTDIVQISGGQAGAISQGGGVDSYAQSGGTVDSVSQGDGHDRFTMSGGTIIGIFDDGDDALMTGGKIGSVNMRLDNNVFDMYDGTIVNNLSTGFGLDRIYIRGGHVGGTISLGDGDDLLEVSGGEVGTNAGAEIRMGNGNDTVLWTSPGIIHAAIRMSAGDDKVVLTGLTETTLSFTPQIDGGPGNDTLNFVATQSATPSRYFQWENVNLTNASRLTLGTDQLVLGDQLSLTGTLNIDPTSTLSATAGAITPYTAGQRVNLNNSGLIDMTTGSTSATDTLTVHGNYNSTGGQLALQSVLGSDGSPSDKLVISQGAIQGTTALRVSNLGGAGAETLQDGIQVVQLLDGATGNASSFALGSSVAAGAYEYVLYKGGVTAGTAEHYYLRSTIPAPTLPGPGGPVMPLPEPVEGSPELPTNPGIKPLPIFRPEVPIYAALFPATQQVVQAMLATFHERMGDQRPQQVDASTAGWGRVYGNSSRQSFAGTVSPTLNSSVTGYQVGSDVYTHTHDNGQVQHAGFFVGHSTLKGDIKGFNLGWQDKEAGNTTLRGDSLGVYWTLIGANQAYLDVVLMGTRFSGNNESDRGVKMKTRGHNVTASAEVGWPFPLTRNWVVEPEAQVIVGTTHLDSQNDGISDVSYNADTNLTTRLGVRLRGDYQASGMPLQPYARANIWHTSAGQNTVTFNGVTDIDTEQKSTTLGISVGATLQVTKDFSVYGEFGYNSNLDSNAFDGRQGAAGMRMKF